MASERHDGPGCTEQLDVVNDLVRTRHTVVVCLPKVIQPTAALCEQREVCVALWLEPQPVRRTAYSSIETKRLQAVNVSVRHR